VEAKGEKETIGQSNGCQQGLALLQGLGRGQAIKNGLFHWKTQKSRILQEVVKTAGM
jgi:hypothetical protein